MNAPQRVDAFEKVYRTEHRRLLRKLRRRVGPDEAPDLVQEAFARLLGARDPERIENPAAYLSRITHNMLINRARKRQRGVPVFYPLDEERTAPTAPAQTRRIDAMASQRLYRRTVRAMPPTTRRVFVMHPVYRTTYTQIEPPTGSRIPTPCSISTDRYVGKERI